MSELYINANLLSHNNEKSDRITKNDDRLMGVICGELPEKEINTDLLHLCIFQCCTED